MPTLRECMDRTILPWDYQRQREEQARGRYGTLVFGGDWNYDATTDHVAVIERQERAWREGTRRFVSGRLLAHTCTTSAGSPTCPACIRQRGWFR